MIESILRRVRGPQPQTQASYRRNLIAGKPQDDETLLGRALDDYKVDEQTLHKRREAAAILAEPDEAAAAVAAAARDVEAARKAMDTHPLAVMLKELEVLRQNFLTAQTTQSSVRGSVGSRRSQATSYLLRTADRDIEKRLLQFNNDEISPLLRARNDVALTGVEVEQRSAAERAVAVLPEKIAAAASGVDAAGLNAELTMARHTLKQFAAREKELVRLDRELAKAEQRRAKIEAERLIADNLELKSKPRPAEL